MRPTRPGLALVAALLLGGCFAAPVTQVGGGGGPVAVPPGPLAPIVQNPAGGPPVECRRVPQRQCLDMVSPDMANFGGKAPVLRIIVTCTGVCTPTEGQVSLDVLTADGRITNVGGAGYAGAAGG